MSIGWRRKPPRYTAGPVKTARDHARAHCSATPCAAPWCVAHEALLLQDPDADPTEPQIEDTEPAEPQIEKSQWYRGSCNPP
jgi:hypothetical protein